MAGSERKTRKVLPRQKKLGHVASEPASQRASHTEGKQAIIVVHGPVSVGEWTPRPPARARPRCPSRLLACGGRARMRKARYGWWVCCASGLQNRTCTSIQPDRQP